jgi:hypothetical protein
MEHKRSFRWSGLFLLALAIIAALILGTRNAQPVAAQAPVMNEQSNSPIPKSDSTDGPIKIMVGTYILGVGNLDMTTGGYTIDFYLTLTCDRPCPEPQFDIMNATDESYKDLQSATDRRYNYRVRADLATRLDLEDYPFDAHTLTIEIEDKSLSNKELVFVVDTSATGVDKYVLVSGWDLDGFNTPEAEGNWQARVEDHLYPVFNNEAYSRYVFSLNISHPWQASFLKGLFAAIVIVGVGMLSFLMTYDDAEDRLNLTAATLASAIFYHMTLTASVPPVGYLTYADQFMILQYIFITIALGIAIALFLLLGKEKHEQGKKLHLMTRWAVPVLWVLSMIALHYFTIGF